jgi:hypothetical protein
MNIQEIRNILINWKEDEFYNKSKSFREYPSPIVDGEYYFVLQRIQKLNFPGKSKTVEAERTFHTQTLASVPLSDNPNADIYRLNKLLQAFDNEYDQKFEEEISIIIKEMNPEGFF